MEQPILQKNHSISPIWILPLVALCLGAWLIYTSYRDAGFNITVHFQSAEGITAGKSVIMYKGIPVGTVKEMRVDDDLSGVTLFIEMKQRCRKAMAKDTTFWIVKPEVSAGRVRGLDTILTGSYIRVQPGSSQLTTKHFEGLPEPPALPGDIPGLFIVLESEALNSLQKGSNVYLKDIQIGSIVDYRLAGDDKVAIKVHIDEDYAHLIKETTKFWNVSGFSAGGDIQGGFDLQIESLAALMYGGISCGTPETPEMGEPVQNGHVFTLYPDRDSAEFGLPMTLQLESAEGVIEGKTRVMCRGVQAGTVKKLRPANETFDTVIAEILLDPAARAILKQGTKFWLIRPTMSVDRVEHLDTLVTGPYITFLPGPGEFTNHFITQQGSPPSLSQKAGRHFILRAPDKGFLEIGSPLYHKKIQVGEVNSISLTDDAQAVRFELLVYDPHANLVGPNSVFWQSGGVSIDADLSGIKMMVPPLKGLLSGGISFMDPDKGKKGPAAADTLFPLYENFGSAMESTPALQPPGLVLQLKAATPGITRVGAPLLHNNIKVGEVLGTSLDRKSGEMVVDVFLAREHARLVNKSSKFFFSPAFTLNAALSGVEFTVGSLESMLSGAIAFITPAPGKKIPANKRFTLYENHEQARHADDLQLTIRLSALAGLDKDSKIKYQGIEIGSITAMDFGPNLREIIAMGSVRADAADLFRESTRLRLIKPKIGFDGVEHLDTLLTGSYVEVIAGQGAARRDFTARETDKADPATKPLHLVLEAERLGSLRKNSPVYYRQIQVGEVIDYTLSPTADSVWVIIGIDAPYIPLVRTATKFWLASGIEVKGGLFSEFQVNAESLESLVRGGICMATPERDEMGRAAKSGDHFTLHETSEKEWLSWRPSIRMPSRIERWNGSHGALPSLSIRLGIRRC